MSADTLAAALRLAEDGLPIFPCRPNKRPFADHGFKDASTDPKVIKDWWQRWPDSLIGVPTGNAPGLLVVDVDPTGAEWYREHQLDLRCGRVHRTRRGHHLLYRMPEVEIRNSAGRVAPGIDVRGEGGFVIWWPACGLETVGDLADVTEPPGWLLKLASQNGAAHTGARYIYEGGRNDLLSREAFRLKKHNCDVSQIDHILSTMNAELCRPPLEDEEIATIARGKSNVEAAPEPSADDGVIITRGDNLEVESIDWLWSGWLARGKLHILAGAPGAGKSTIAIGLAATVTSGGRWPDGTACGLAGVLVWSGEDDPADTILPRFLAAGGDPKSLHIITGIADANGPRPFDPGTDIAALSAAARKNPHLALLIVDPVVAAVIEDSHKNVEVRRALQPLVTLGADLGLAVLGISHFTKGTAGRDPVERVTGSLAFGALPRVVMAAAKANGDGERRIFCRAKSNIGLDTGGWEYRLVLTDVPGAPNVTVVRTEWGDALEGNARELLADAEAVENSDDASEWKRDRTRLKAAAQWLRELLSKGGLMVKDIETEANAAGYAWRLIRDAKDELRINPQKAGYAKGWQWNLPEDDVHAPKEDDVTAPSEEPAPDKAFTEDAVTSPWCGESTSPSASSSSNEGADLPWRWLLTYADGHTRLVNYVGVGGVTREQVLAQFSDAVGPPGLRRCAR